MNCSEVGVECTKIQPKLIKAINKDAVHKICSGQVVLNLAIAVKELVENALDAGASSIEVKLKEYGQDLIEVVDNGSGVEEENFSALTLKYHTSKLREFSDLLGVSTFGFRGEALSSLCALSDVVVTTRHSSKEHGTKITYDYKGLIKDTTICARQIGTTVCLTNLFKNLPVRQKEFHRNIKREFNKMTQLLYAYCIVCEGVKFTCTNFSKGNKSLIVATQGGSLRDNIACVFGIKQLQSLLNLQPVYPENSVSNLKEKIFKDLKNDNIKLSQDSEDPLDITDIKSDHELELSEESSNDANDITLLKRNLSDSTYYSSQSSSSNNLQLDCVQFNSSHKHPFDFTGLISSSVHGSGRSTNERQFFYINSRPCEPQKVMKIVNEVYKQYNPHQYPFIFLNVKVKRSSVDVNVTPDKRKIFLDKEKNLLDILKHSLNCLFEPISSTLKIENSKQSQLSQININSSQTEIEKAPRVFSSFLSQFASKINNDPFISDTKERNENKRKASSLDNYVQISKPVHEKKVNNNQNQKLEKICNDKESLIDETNEIQLSSPSTPPKNLNTNSESSNDDMSNLKEAVFLGYCNKLPLSQVVDINEVVNNDISYKIPTKKSKPNIDENVSFESNKKENEETCRKTLHTTIDNSTNEQSTIKRKTCTINISLSNIKTLMLENSQHINDSKKKIDKVKFRTQINPVLNKKCEEELKKELSKDMFKSMKIIGQFNLGFIITQLDDDLFIIDQHATDEKYNFETLQKTTILSHQKLVIPQPLNLTGVNERVLLDNLEICEKNGFTFEINEDAPPTKRVKLLTIPISRNYVFGKDDVEELLYMLKEAPNELCRPSRIQTMFASRACRKSVMIGTALNKTVMRNLIDHMSLIDHPWNCPHGRPTIRHLINMALMET